MAIQPGQKAFADASLHFGMLPGMIIRVRGDASRGGVHKDSQLR
jgi:hypothetical protein